MSVIMLSGAYYEYFGEKEFFQQHPKLYKKMKAILQTVLESREENEPYLYRTTWIPMRMHWESIIQEPISVCTAVLWH